MFFFAKKSIVLIEKNGYIWAIRLSLRISRKKGAINKYQIF